MTDSIISVAFFGFFALATVMSVLFFGLMVADDHRKEPKK